MGLKRGDRLLFPPEPTKEIIIVRVEPCTSIEFQGPGTEGMVHPDFRFERPAVRPEIDQTIGTVLPEWRHDREARSEEHTSELQSRLHLVCRLLLEKKKHR